MANPLSNILKSVLRIVNLLKSKPKPWEIIPILLAEIMGNIAEGQAFAGLDSRGKLDTALEEFDLRTGLTEDELAAVNLWKNLPPDKEEEFMDHFKEMIRIAGYNKLKVDGYFVEGS